MGKATAAITPALHHSFHPLPKATAGEANFTGWRVIKLRCGLLQDRRVELENQPRDIVGGARTLQTAMPISAWPLLTARLVRL